MGTTKAFANGKELAFAENIPISAGGLQSRTHYNHLYAGTTVTLFATFDIKLVILYANQDDQAASTNDIIICTEYIAFSMGGGSFVQLSVDRTNTTRWILSAWSYTTYAGTIFG